MPARQTTEKPGYESHLARENPQEVSRQFLPDARPDLKFFQKVLTRPDKTNFPSD